MSGKESRFPGQDLNPLSPTYEAGVSLNRHVWTVGVTLM